MNGGREQAISTDLIWPLNHNVRLMFDWTRAVKLSGTAWNAPVNPTGEGLGMLTVWAGLAF